MDMKSSMLLWKEKISNRLSFQSSILPQTVQEDDSSRRRRRHHRHLMTTTSTNTMTSTSYNNNTMAFNPNAVTCTSFLMGGAYYPGKDKKVLHMRRKTLWYRIGWSSPIRRGLSLLLLLYVLIYVIWIPLISFLMHYGHLLSKNSNHPLNAKNTNVNMNTNVNTNVNTNSNANNTNTQSHHEIHLDSKITNLKASSHKRIRYNIIQQLVPDWIPKRHYEEDPNDHHHPLKQEEEYKEQDAQTLTFPSKQNDMDIPSSNTHPSVPLRTLNNRYMHDTNSKCYTRNETSNNNNMMKNGITLVLQGTLDRLPLIRLTCQRWNQAPIVMVVYMKHDEDHDDDNDDDLLSWSDLVWKYTSTCPHLTLIPYTPLSQIEEQDPDPDPEQDTNNNNNNNNSNSNNSKSQTTSWYPINKLRNIALDHVQTTHVLVLDVDFIPSEGLDEAIQNVLQQGTTHDNDAIVVPAFQRKAREPPCSNLEACLQYIQKDFIPTSTMELKTCIRSKNCDIFQKDVKPQGHMDTRYSRWIKEIDATSITTTKSSMHQIECFSTLDYEPYVVIPWCPSVESNPSNDNNRTLTPRSPYYDERFQGYGKNKIQMTSHLRYLGYKFWIMPSTGFITHFPHSTSKTKKDWIHNKENLHQRMDQLYSHYLNELEHTYQNEFEIMTPLCSDLVQ